MKSFKFYGISINPIYRDLVLVMVTGFAISLIIVTLGIMVLRSGV